MGALKSLGTISVTAKQGDFGGQVNDMISERLHSVNNPLAIVDVSVDGVTGGARAERWDGEVDDTGNNYSAAPGSNVTFTVNRLVPDYLQPDDEDIQISWLINGTQVWDGAYQQINQEFVDANPDMNLAAGPTSLSLTLEGTYGSGLAITARVAKIFESDEVAAFEEAWGFRK